MISIHEGFLKKAAIGLGAVGALGLGGAHMAGEGNLGLGFKRMGQQAGRLIGRQTDDQKFNVAKNQAAIRAKGVATSQAMYGDPVAGMRELQRGIKQKQDTISQLSGQTGMNPADRFAQARKLAIYNQNPSAARTTQARFLAGATGADADTRFQAARQRAAVQSALAQKRQADLALRQARTVT